MWSAPLGGFQWRLGRIAGGWGKSSPGRLPGPFCFKVDCKDIQILNRAKNNSAQKFSMLPSKIQFYIISNKGILFLEGNGYAVRNGQ